MIVIERISDLFLFKDFFLKPYIDDSFFIRKKATNVLFCGIVLVILLLVAISIHTFITVHGTVYQTGDAIAYVFVLSSLFFLKKHFLELAINLLCLSISSLLVIHNVIGDYYISQPLTHFRVLETTVSIFILYFLISLTAIKSYQSLLFVTVSIGIVLLHTYIIFSVFYNFNPDPNTLSHFLFYFFISLFGGILCFRVLKTNNEAIYFLDKKNDELEEIINERTQKLAFLFDEKEKFYVKSLENEARFKGIIENADDIFFTLDLQGTITFISPKIQEITGCTEEDLIGKSYSDIFVQLDRNPLTIPDITLKKIETEVCIINGSGELQWFSLHSSPIVISNNKYIIGIARDITEMKKNEALLIRYANMDEMTGALNRYAGLNTLSEYLTSGTPLSVCYIDLDDLKFINDTYGHDEGDHAIITTVKTIREYIGETDILCRVGGDEFILILPDTSLDNAEKICSQIVDRLKGINDSKTKPYHILISFGCEECKANSCSSLDNIIKAIDHKMYLQKASHKNKAQ